MSAALPGALPLGWIGASPRAVAKGVTPNVTAAIFSMPSGVSAELAPEVPADLHLICVTLAGSIDWDARFEDRRVTLACRTGSVDLGRAGERASLRYASAGARFAHFYLPIGWFNQTLDELTSRTRVASVELIDPMHARCDEVLRLGQSAEAIVSRGGPATRLEIEALSLNLAATLVRRHSNAAVSVRHRGGLPPYLVKRVTDYMSDRMAEDLSISELAALVDLSLYHFCRAFKQSTGSSPWRWLTERRIERAKEMMASHPKMGLSEVALAVGYQSQTAFGVAFRRLTGRSPRQWRQELAQ